jgi:ubiquinone/menaquinone biosynthesis C-methylase UbiE
MFSRSAKYYDVVYSFKQYDAEAKKIHDLIQRHKTSAGVHLLDVACGTGGHIAWLAQHYLIDGTDLDPEMLEVARRRYPELRFHEADMASFDLGRRFDAVICLFSSIGYVKTVQRLRRAVACMARHLETGGVLIVEPWLTAADYRTGMPHALFVDRPDLKIARINVSAARGRLSVLDFHYLIATPDGVEKFQERHELGMFSHEEYSAAFERAGLSVAFDPEGLTGRGLYIGLSAAGPATSGG